MIITNVLSDAINMLLSLLVSAIGTIPLTIAFDMCSQILGTSFFSFKITDIYNILPNVGISYGALFKTIGYSLIMILSLFSILKSMTAPITGAQSKSPVQYLVNGVISVVLMILIFGIGSYDGLINVLGDQMNVFMEWITEGFIGSNGSLASTADTVAKEMTSSSIGSNAIAQIVFIIAVCVGIVKAAITYVERYLSLAIYLALGPVCVGFNAADETKGTLIEWFKTIFATMLTIIVTIFCWRLFFAQVVLKWTYLNLAISMALLALIQNSEKLVNALGLRTIATGEAARSLGSAIRTASMLAKDTAMTAGQIKRGVQARQQSKLSYATERMNAKNDSEIGMAAAKYKASGLFKNPEKAWNAMKNKYGINDGRGELGIADRKANMFKDQYATKLGQYRYRNEEGYKNWKQHNDALKHNSAVLNQAAKIKDGTNPKFADKNEQQRSAAANKYLNNNLKKVPSLNTQGKAFDSEFKQAQAALKAERDDKLRSVGRLDSTLAKETSAVDANKQIQAQAAMFPRNQTLKSSGTIGANYTPLTEAETRSLESGVSGVIASRNSLADNTAKEQIKSASTFAEVNRAAANREAVYQNSNSGLVDDAGNALKTPTLVYSDSERAQVEDNLLALRDKGILNSRGDGAKVADVNKDFEKAWTTAFGEAPNNVYYVPQFESTGTAIKVGSDANGDIDIKQAYQFHIPEHISKDKQDAIARVNETLTGNREYVDGADIMATLDGAFDKSIKVVGGVPASAGPGEQDAVSGLMCHVINTNTGVQEELFICPTNEAYNETWNARADDENIKVELTMGPNNKGIYLCGGTDQDSSDGFIGVFLQRADENQASGDDITRRWLNYSNYFSVNGAEDPETFYKEHNGE